MRFILEENKVIWNSTAMMAVCDLLAIGLTFSILAAAVKYSDTPVGPSDTRGPLFIVAAVIVTGIFSVTDLTTIFILPIFMGEDKAHVMLDYLNLNVRSIVTTMTVALIFIGFVRTLMYRKRTAIAYGCLMTKLVHCEEHERQRIANYLHDHVGQSLVALRIKLDLSSREANATERTKDTKQFIKLLDETIEMTEDLTYELHPPILSERGLSATIEWLGNKFSSEYKVRFDCIVEGSPVAIDMEDAALLYRIGRELMLNVIKHANTDSARVTLRWCDETVSMEVADEGAGYDPSKPASTGGGLRFGLPSVRERVTALGGSYAVETQLGGGTRVALNMPLNRRAQRLAEVMA